MSLFDRMFGAREVPVPTHVPSPDADRELVLYKYDACPYCARVAREIRRMGIDVPTRDTRMEPDARRELLDATHRTQVPCLFIDGQPLFESADIIAWLDRYATRAERAAQAG